MTNTRYKILFYLFSIFLAFSLFAISVVYVLASPTHNIGSQINVNYVAPVNVNLNFVNNTGSNIEEGSYSIKYNEDMTQFYIDGIVPSNESYQNGSIINDKGQEFYYFSNVPQDMEICLGSILYCKGKVHIEELTVVCIGEFVLMIDL